MIHSYTTLVFTFALFGIQGNLCLRLTGASFPAFVEYGDSVELSVAYNLEGENLEDIMWVKDGEVIQYYHSPTQLWRAHDFNGGKIEVCRNAEKSLCIDDVNNEASGTYTVKVRTSEPNNNLLIERMEITVDDSEIASSQPRTSAVNDALTKLNRNRTAWRGVG